MRSAAGGERKKLGLRAWASPLCLGSIVAMLLNVRVNKRYNQRGFALAEDIMAAVAITALVVLPVVAGAIVAGSEVVQQLDVTTELNKVLSD